MNAVPATIRMAQLLSGCAERERGQESIDAMHIALLRVVARGRRVSALQTMLNKVALVGSTYANDGTALTLHSTMHESLQSTPALESG